MIPPRLARGVVSPCEISDLILRGELSPGALEPDGPRFGEEAPYFIGEDEGSGFLAGGGPLGVRLLLLFDC